MTLTRIAPAAALCAATAAALLAAAPALAGGTAPPPAEAVILPTAPAPAPRGADWTGLYAGGQLAYGDVEVTGAATAEGTGALFGVFGGYRHDFGALVLGGEVDLDAAAVDLGAAGTLDAVARAGLEAGWDAGPALVYGTAGLAWASVDAPGDRQVGHGAFWGAGVDYALSDRVTIGAEVLHHVFEDFDDVTGLDVGATTIGLNAALRF